MKRFLRYFNRWLILCIVISTFVIGLSLWFGGDEGLGRISGILQVITTALAVTAWLSAQKMLNEHNQMIRSIKENAESVVLVIDIGKKDIDGQVESFVNEASQEIILKGSIPDGFAADYSKRFVTISGKDMPENEDAAGKYRTDFVDSVTAVASFLRQKGVTDIHLFYQGPLVLSYYLGEIFKNNFNVANYHHTHGGDNKYVAV